MTTQANATVTVGEGQTVGLEFGSRIRLGRWQPGVPAEEPEAAGAADQQPQRAPAAAQQRAGTPGWLVYPGVGAIPIGHVVLGWRYLWLLRR